MWLPYAFWQGSSISPSLYEAWSPLRCRGHTKSRASCQGHRKSTLSTAAYAGPHQPPGLGAAVSCRPRLLWHEAKLKCTRRLWQCCSCSRTDLTSSCSCCRLVHTTQGGWLACRPPRHRRTTQSWNAVLGSANASGFLLGWDGSACCRTIAAAINSKERAVCAVGLTRNTRWTLASSILIKTNSEPLVSLATSRSALV